MKKLKQIFVFSTLGSNSNEEDRIKSLLSEFDFELLPFDRAQKLKMFRVLLSRILQYKPDLVVMEGSGIAGGLSLIVARILIGQKYVVSSGDAIGPWIRTHSRVWGLPFLLYEKLLCRYCAGFIGWTPYLVGRAMTFGAPRAVTAAGWAPFKQDTKHLIQLRESIRKELNIPEHAVVIGIAGSLQWSKRVKYCYGYEIVEAIKRLKRSDVYGLVVGDGSGLPVLKKIAGDLATTRIIFTGRVPQADIPKYLAAMDIGSLPQSVDQTGAFRYTTKISEYIDCILPMVTGHVPMGYDLDDGWIWRLSGEAPWKIEYIQNLTTLLEDITRESITEKKSSIPKHHPIFNKQRQIDHITAFISDLLQKKIICRKSSQEEYDVSATVRNTPSSAFAITSKKQLITIGHSYVLGVNRRLPHELERNSKGRWQVTVVAPKFFKGRNDIRPNYFERSPNESVSIEAVAASWTGNIHAFHYESRLRQILQSADLVHAWEEPYIYAGWQIARYAPKNIPLVFRTAQSLNKKYPPPFNWIEQYCIQRMNGWIYSGRLVEQNLLTRPGYARHPRCYAPLGFDPNLLSPDRSSGKAIRNSLGFGDNTPVVGFLGRFVCDKGIRVLMQAAERLPENVGFLFVGNGPMHKEVVAWSHRRKNVRICSDVKHETVGGYINAMDMVTIPSLTTPRWREQFGRVIVEAFACGVPVIGSDSGEIPYVIGQNGIVVPENDFIKLADAIQLLIDSPELNKSLSERGLQIAHECYSWEKIAIKTLGFFDEVMQSR